MALATCNIGAFYLHLYLDFYEQMSLNTFRNSARAQNHLQRSCASATLLVVGAVGQLLGEMLLWKLTRLLSCPKTTETQLC